jgi:phosphate uptake regulator
MKRKVIKLAGTTYVVSLPLKWVREQRIEKGDEMEVLAEGSKVSISRESNLQEGRKCSVNIGNNPETGKRYLVTLYRLGYDEIEIGYSDPEYKRVIPEILAQSTIGLVIIDQKENRTTIKDLSGTKSDELGSIERRMWFISSEMIKDIERYVNESNYAELKNMYLREKNINQLMNYCIRLIVSQKGENLQYPFSKYYFIRQLESITDSYRDLAVNHAREKLKPSKELLKGLSGVNRLFWEFDACYHSFKLEKIEEILRHSEKLSEYLSDELRSIKDIKQALGFTYLNQIIALIRGLCSPMIELNLPADQLK